MTSGFAAEDTIVALASGRGAAGVAVIRLSGSDALGVLDRVFRGRLGAGHISSGRLIFGAVVEESGEEIDECLAVRMPGPKSFTGEDVAEIQCHGSQAVVSRIIERCMESGARLAEPGEFSRRAFLNGKMDLAQAEALSDLIAARSEASRKLALRQLRGGLSQRVSSLYSDMLDAAAEIEAHIDFPEEDIPALAHERILGRMDSAAEEMRKLLAGHERARIQSEGARVILAGEPNAGKSSLFNALAGRERAIVSPHPGTTRDTIEATLEIGGLAITLVDTAGIRSEAEEVERIGIERSLEEIRSADLVLHLAEDGAAFNTVALAVAKGENVLQVLTKCDGSSAENRGFAGLRVSSVTGAGLAELEREIRNRLVGSQEDSNEADMSRVRQAQCLRAGLESLARAQEAMARQESGDLVMVDMRDALSSVGEILGERLDEQILDRIFSTFCLGK